MINYVAHFLYEKCDTYHGVKNDNIKNKSMRLFLPLIDIFIPSYVFMKKSKVIYNVTGKPNIETTYSYLSVIIIVNMMKIWFSL